MTQGERAPEITVRLASILRNRHWTPAGDKYVAISEDAPEDQAVAVFEIKVGAIHSHLRLPLVGRTVDEPDGQLRKAALALLHEFGYRLVDGQ